MATSIAPAPADPELVNSIEDFLKPMILELEPERRRGPGRPRIVPALALWAGLLVCVLHGVKAQRELWRLLTLRGLWDFPRFALSDDAVYARLKTQSCAGLQTLFAQVTALLRARLAGWSVSAAPLAAFAQGVYVLDETTLDRVLKCLPALRAQTETVLGGKLSAVFDVRAQLWHHLSYTPEAQANEKAAARELLASVPSGSLILADLGYFAFKWFDDLTAAGYFWISRLRQKTSYTLVHTFYASPDVLDALVWLGAHRADRTRHMVRLVRFAQRGIVRSYITNVRDPRVLPLAEIARLYARRWDIEMMFDLVKTHLQLHLLWSAHPTVIAQQVFAVFIIAQCLLGLRNDLARQAQADVFEISLELFVRWVPRLLADGQDPIAVLVERGRFGLIIRPSKRTQIHVPEVPLSAYLDPPPNLPTTREPRYAGKP